MSWENEMVTAIQQAAGTFNRDIVSLVLCNVDSISDDGFSCSCTPIGSNADTQIPDVKLNAEANDGFLITPAVDSTVLVAASTRSNYYIFMYSDIEKVTCIIDDNNSYEFSNAGFIWNSGTFGGMAKTAVLATKLNNLENKVNALVGYTATHTHLGVTAGAGVTGITATPVTGALTPTTQTEIEDTKIKH